jgi:predicted DNA-binding transcriptional regulator AlpA
MDSAAILDRQGAASVLGISRASLDRHLRTWRATGGRVGIPHARLSGRCIRIRSADLDAWLAQQIAATCRARRVPA